MDFGGLYHFLFETFEGVGILVGAGIVISIIVCIILERRTRKVYKNHEAAPEEDEWSTVKEEFEEGEAEEMAKEAGRKKAN